MISKQAKKALAESATIQGMLADAFKRSPYAITRWIKTDSKMLSTDTAIDIIANGTGLTREQILSDKKVAA